MRRGGLLRRLTRRLLRLGFWAAAAVVAWVALYAVVPPPTTVLIEMERWRLGGVARDWRGLDAISPHLVRAAIAAEDARFCDHWGFDLKAIEAAVAERERGRVRGASTISQQLVKNLFFTTHRSPVRKLIEYTLTPPAELLLTKDRILELYLNEIEWGPGVWGAAAAAEHHYGIGLQSLTREQAARLAACIPAPLTRRPQRMDRYAAIILERMAARGW